MESKPKNLTKPLVSIIIPTKGNIKLLKPCLESIRKSTYNNYEIIIVDNSRKEETKKYLSGSKYAILFYNEEFNFAKINNLAAKYAEGEHIIFLNDDTEIISPDWMEKMIEYSVKPNVGAVGALLFYLDDTIQHAGVLIGVGGIAIHAFEGLPRKGKEFEGSVQTVRECSAVTGACLMIKKRLFEQVGGFDEKLAFSFNDVDLCLRLRENGYLVIFTPHAQLYHHGTASRSYAEDNEEIQYFVNRWHDLILRGDPYYDQKLSRVKPFGQKMDDEKLVLSHNRLINESEKGTYKRLEKYVEVADKIRRRHGTLRLMVEFLRFLKEKIS